VAASQRAHEQAQRRATRRRPGIGQDGSARTAGRAPLEGQSERLRGQLVGEISAGAAMQVPMDGVEVSLEDRLERLRVAQRARQAIDIRRWLHHP
jgi:hypothetical protein